MKTLKRLYPFLLAAGALSMAACNNNGGGAGGADSTASAAKTDSSSMIAKSSPEQDFINAAVPGNTKEMIWLQAGIDKGGSELKSHARMMLADHQKLDATVKNYLSAHSNISVPVVDTTNTVTINDKSGKDWDKAWAGKMVDDHQGLLDKLKTAQKEVTDTALLAIVNSTIPVVESHLAMVKTLEDKMK